MKYNKINKKGSNKWKNIKRGDCVNNTMLKAQERKEMCCRE